VDCSQVNINSKIDSKDRTTIPHLDKHAVIISTTRLKVAVSKWPWRQLFVISLSFIEKITVISPNKKQQKINNHIKQ
jgi:hypothetical protein